MTRWIRTLGCVMLGCLAAVCFVGATGGAATAPATAPATVSQPTTKATPNNPEYEAWARFKPGSSVSMLWNVPNQAPQVITDTLVEVTAEKVILSRVISGQEAKEASRREILAKLGAEEEMQRKEGRLMVLPGTKKEVVEVMGKKFETTVETTGESSPIRNYMWYSSATEWKTAEVPGGMLKRVTKTHWDMGNHDITVTYEVREFRVVP